MRLRLPWSRRPENALGTIATVWAIEPKGAMFCAIEYGEHSEEPTGRACAARTLEGLTGLLRKMNLREIPPWHPSYQREQTVWR